MNLIQCASYSRKGILKIPVAKTSHYRRGENIRCFAGLLEFGSARFGGFYRALRGRHRLQRDGQRLATYEFHVMQIPHHWTGDCRAAHRGRRRATASVNPRRSCFELSDDHDPLHTEN
jgi:hypothetical protein